MDDIDIFIFFLKIYFIAIGIFFLSVGVRIWRSGPAYERNRQAIKVIKKYNKDGVKTPLFEDLSNQDVIRTNPHYDKKGGWRQVAYLSYSAIDDVLTS